jgi:hypothetical protein
LFEAKIVALEFCGAFDRDGMMGSRNDGAWPFRKPRGKPPIAASWKAISEESTGWDWPSFDRD